MKRARSEHIQALVLNYLKKRNYTDSEASYKLEFKFEETQQEMCSRLTEDTDVSTTNAVKMAIFTIDDYFSAFENFINFSEQVADGHPKLIVMIYPIFCHIYLDLVMSSRKGDATEFFGLFEDRVVKPSNVQYPPVQKLARIIQPSDLDACNQIKEFRCKKFSINVPLSTESLLMRYLHASSCLVLLKIINLHFSINIIEDKNLLELFSTSPKKKNTVEGDSALKKRKVKSSEQVEPQVKSEPVTLIAPSLSSPAPVSTQPDIQLNPEVDIKTLRDSIQKVHDLKPSVDNICLHRLSNTSSIGLTHTNFSNDFQWISSGMEDSTVRLWDMSHNQRDTKVNNICPDLSRDVSQVYLGCDSFTSEHNPSMSRPTNLLHAHSGTVTCSCFSHDDRFLITGSEDTTVRLWDLSSRKNKVLYRGHVHPVWCIAMSNYSFYFATGSFDKTAKLWTLERTHPIRTFVGHQSDVETVVFHGNSTYIATADKAVRLWDINSGKTVRILVGHWASVLCVAFSPSGKFLASSGEDGRIRLWDIASGSLIKEIRGHEGSVYSLDFSPDGTMLASGGADSCLRVWNTRTSQTPQTRGNTDVNDPKVNPDFIGRWHCGGDVIHTVKFEAVNLLHCICSDR